MLSTGLGLVAALAAVPFVVAQDGSLTGPTSSSAAAGYSCDPNQCKLPSCNCASTSPPGGLDPSQVPQFVTFTADDAIQSYTIDAVNQFLGSRLNPNGCPVKMTYFTSLNYTNYTLVTDWYVAGNEIADHTMTHVGTPPNDEVMGNLIALNALAGIPLPDIIGFRAPFLNYSVDTLTMLHNAGFTYDSSASASLPVGADGTDAFWPYTLDNGLANDCLTVENACKGNPKLPGFWEIPMYALFDQRGAAGVHLMDPWLDAANGNSNPDDEATLQYMQSTFSDHYKGNRQPFGLYTHPIHLATDYPGVPAPTPTINMINDFLDWAQEQDDVWIVSNEQMLAWIKNPVPVSQLNNIPEFHCQQPKIDSSKQICNGIPQNEAGLVEECMFTDFPFYTCYGCPTDPPTPSNPNPDQSNKTQTRHRISSNCTTAFWDPVQGTCLCEGSSCQYNDLTQAIGPNGANLTGGGSRSSLPTPKASNFNGAADLVLSSASVAGVLGTAVVGVVGAVMGWTLVGI
ncbi:hypothetical protein CONPUDRAFT_116476 [Coniophora puteana RWD-64-598 SS2]|uniref:Chitin deacetylase n=1 Tax=Coniophora puteana (strain RWD-64-598) TaxID=741705 RepID=A0A5M3N772_CONPW|nr:uncharacterized protein CONPUDRAFT_116476 [Coniophora puteana RWD-64-598 SS2]EIW87292.1 hypothetical protein CONPUDRAFT_116476 [Coniophora puteana RWD-64-598 SS2]